MKLKSILVIEAVLMFITALPALALETKGVVATIKPLHSLVAGVMGETGEPALVVTDQASPHDFHLRPSQVKALQSAAVLFYIDESFETFLHDAFKSLSPHVRKSPIAQKASLALVTRRQRGIWAESLDTNYEYAVSEGDLSAFDMHVWLDPKNAKKIVAFIAQELSFVYPENKDIYNENARILLDQLHRLDARLKEEVFEFKKVPFIVFHDAYQYFEKHYGLKGLGSMTLEPDEALSPHQIKAVRLALKEKNVTCVFREPYFSDKLVAIVLEGSAAKMGTLDPEGTALAPGKDLYFVLMENLVKNLKHCLSP